MKLGIKHIDRVAEPLRYGQTRHGWILDNRDRAVQVPVHGQVRSSKCVLRFRCRLSLQSWQHFSDDGKSEDLSDYEGGDLNEEDVQAAYSYNVNRFIGGVAYKPLVYPQT